MDMYKRGGLEPTFWNLGTLSSVRGAVNQTNMDKEEDDDEQYRQDPMGAQECRRNILTWGGTQSCD